MATFHNTIFTLGDTVIDIILNGHFTNTYTMSQSTTMHFHPHYECHFINTDDFRMNLNDNLCTLNALDICIIPPLFKHYPVTQYTHHEDLSIAFSFKHQHSSDENSIFELLSKVYSNLTDAKIVHGLNLYDKYIHPIYELLRTDNLLKPHKAKALLKLLFIELTEILAKEMQIINDTPTEPLENNKYVDRQYLIDWYITKNYMCDISLKTLAEHLSLSPRQTDRVLKNASKLNFSGLLLKTRMIAAQELITKTATPISEIALSVGYKSYNAFYAAFKNFFNTSPQKMRDNINNL